MKSIIVILGIAILLAFGCVGQLPISQGIGGICLPTSGIVCGNDLTTYDNSCKAAAADTTVNHTGACIAPSCIDTDGGKDLFRKGIANGSTGSVEDACINANTVGEAYCNGSEAILEMLTCSIGYECKSGACIKAACTDTDGGKDTETKGTTTAQDISKTDACSSDFSVNEFFCEGITVSNMSMACDAGKECASGACREAACNDSDGDNSGTAGTITKGADSYNDSCESNTSVKEYYCEANAIKSRTAACAEGYKCSAGRCAKDVCVDSDDGRQIGTKGTTTFGEISYTDSCYSATTLLEYYCSSDTVVSHAQIECGTNKECYDGICRAVVCTDIKTNVSKKDARHLIAALDDSEELSLYVGDAVEINNGMFLELEGTTENYSTFRLYENYADYQDSDALCSKDLEEGDTKTSLCSKSINDLEVNNINDGDGYVDITLEEFFATQYYSEKGSIENWTDNAICDEDTASFTSHESYFYPYVSDSGGLDLGNKKFMLFGQEAKIVSVSSDAFTFNLGGKEYDVSDGDTFEYYNRDYQVSLEFSEGGLHVLTITPD
jgi:hypothetical protein